MINRAARERARTAYLEALNLAPFVTEVPPAATVATLAPDAAIPDPIPSYIKVAGAGASDSSHAIPAGQAEGACIVISRLDAAPSGQIRLTAPAGQTVNGASSWDVVGGNVKGGATVKLVGTNWEFMTRWSE